MRTRRPLAALALACLVLIANAGCERRITLATRGGDSTHTAQPDSLAALIMQAQSAWEAGVGEDAARLSAQMLLADLAHRPSDHWEARAHTLLDSLAIGAEFASATCVLAVNFFARSNPDAGSWPYLISCSDNGPLSQAIEARDLHLMAGTLAVVPAPKPQPIRIPFAPPKDAGHGPLPSALALLFTRRAGGGQQPLVMVWSHARREDPWNLIQTLDADSLGGVGTADFERRDSLDLVTRTYQASRGFDECSGCPHLYRMRRFRWRGDGFDRIEDQRVPSPYGTFVMFVTALSLDDRDGASHYVTDGNLVDRARSLDWGRPKGSWRVAPDTEEGAQHMVFFRGREEAYQVDFAVQGRDWKISGFQPTQRTIE